MVREKFIQDTIERIGKYFDSHPQNISLMGFQQELIHDLVAKVVLLERLTKAVRKHLSTKTMGEIDKDDTLDHLEHLVLASEGIAKVAWIASVDKRFFFDPYEESWDSEIGTKELIQTLYKKLRGKKIINA